MKVVVPVCVALLLGACATAPGSLATRDATETSVALPAPETTLVPAAPETSLSATIETTALGRMVREAVLSSPAAMANSAGLRGARADVASARADYRPQVSLGAELDDQGTLAPALTLSQLIYDGGQARARSRVAAMEAERRREDQVAALSAETLAAFEAAIALRAARARQAEAQSNLAAHERLFDMVAERTDAGVGSTVDRGVASARLTAARSGLMEAEAAVSKATAGFRAAFGTLPPDRLPEIPRAPGFGRTDPAEIVEVSAQMRALRFAEAQQQARIGALRAGRTPRLALTVTSALGQRASGPDVRSGLGVQMPVSSGGRYRADLEAAEQELLAIQADQAALRRALINALDDALADLNSRGARLDNARAAVRAARAAFEMAREQYGIGKVSITRLLDTQKELSSAEQALIDVEAETALDGYTILAVTGDILAAVGVWNPREPVSTPEGG